MDPMQKCLVRRHFLGQSLHALGYGALASLLGPEWVSGGTTDTAPAEATPRTQHAPRARQVIFLHMVGGPPQMELFDHKPQLIDWAGKELPRSARQGQRLPRRPDGKVATRFSIAPSKLSFRRHGQAGMWVSELLPWTARMADDLCLVRSMHTEAINHDPAITCLQTGNQLPGHPPMGAWASYGLGSLNQNLPTFVVLVARPSAPSMVQPVNARVWHSAFLPGEHAGALLRSSGDPILCLRNPPGVADAVRRRTLDGIRALNELHYQELGDPETATRIEQYEMAYRMQTSAPELLDLAQESENTFTLYGPEARTPGTFANTVLLARRLVERGVRFVQIFHNGWDMHQNLPRMLTNQCRDVDQGCYALVQDLKRRGLLETTLLVWGGEFGRAIFAEGDPSGTCYGRDHHGRCFTMWLAGGGIRPGIYGETDDFSYNIVRDSVHIRDLHATMLHLLGFDHQRLSFRYQGLDQRLTGTGEARVIDGLLA
jgi:uncharacterized protein (DUF1501 family)